MRNDSPSPTKSQQVPDPPRGRLTFRDIDRLSETLKWPVALIILGAMFSGSIGQLLTAPAHTTERSLTPPSATLVATVIAADPLAIRNPDRLAYETSIALEAQRLLAQLPTEQRVTVRVTTGDGTAAIGLLQSVGFRVDTGYRSDGPTVILSRGRPARIFKQGAQVPRDAPISTASDPIDLVFRLAVLVNSASAK
jgi:hypothetical protein